MTRFKRGVPVALIITGLFATGAVQAQDATKAANPQVAPPAAEATPQSALQAPVTEVAAPPALQSPASAAQLKREHQRAKKVGDTANDPFNSASSDALNKAQLANSVALTNAPATPDTATPDTAPQNTATPSDPQPPLLQPNSSAPVPSQTNDGTSPIATPDQTKPK